MRLRCHITDAPFVYVSLVLLFSMSGGVTVSKRGSAKSCSAPFLCPDSSLCHSLSLFPACLSQGLLDFSLGGIVFACNYSWLPVDVVSLINNIINNNMPALLAFL